MLSASDDARIGQWGPDGEWSGELTQTPDYGITDMHATAANPDIFVAACSDGAFRLFTRGGKEDKRVEASAAGAAIICCRWSHDGSALATGGEDGAVKVWSRTGMLRTSLAAASKAVYAVSWSADGTSLLYASGRELSIVSLQAEGGSGGVKQPRALTWKAHEGTVLAAHWSPVNNRVVSGGEDCRYRVWDTYGRQLFVSAPLEHVVTSVAWSPSGDVFAVGSFDTLRLCDPAGWSHARERLPGAGSLQSLAWCSDGGVLAAGTGSGSVQFCSLIEKRLSCGSMEAVQADATRITVTDAASGSTSEGGGGGGGDREELDFRDRVTDFTLGYGHLVASTPTQCSVFSSSAWHAPHVFDIRSPLTMIAMAPRAFLTADPVTGINVYSYEGPRLLCSPKHAGIKPDLLSKQHVSLSNDVVAVLDRSDNLTIRCFDVRNGRALGPGGGYTHTTTVTAIAVSQCTLGGLPERRVAFVDSSHDLWITPIVRPSPVKVATMVDAVAWDEAPADVLLAIADGRLSAWLCPSAFWIDLDLAAAARTGDGSRPISDHHGGHGASNGLVVTSASSSQQGGGAGPSFGPLPTILSCAAGRIAVQRGDGGVIHASIPGHAYSTQLYESVGQGRWEDAVRLCRFVKDGRLWACLAALSLSAKHLDTAEVALAAVGAVDKLQFILHVKEQRLPEVRAAELALYRKQPDEAEAILLQAQPPLLYRAIKLNIKLARWQRALDLATTHKTHIDTVLAYRQRYLASLHRQETMEPFTRALASIGGAQSLDWPAIKARKDQEKAREGMAGHQQQQPAARQQQQGQGGQPPMMGGGRQQQPAAASNMMMGSAGDGKDNDDEFLG